jgi:DNA-binding NarL/FixJ family response regulator
MPSHQLTPAEWAIVNLLSEGLSNRAIAQRQVISVRTVESHISHALDKTGCRSRLELVVWRLGLPLGPGADPAVTLPLSPA